LANAINPVFEGAKMTLLTIGLLLFFAIHLLPRQESLKQQLQDRLGKRGYLFGFSLLSIITLLLIIYGKATAPYIELWTPPWYGVLRHLTYAFNLLFSILLVAMFIPCNLRRRLHHPMLLGVGCWGIGHMLVNGDLASLLLFASFTIYAFYSVYSAIQRQHLCQLTVQPNWRDALVVGLGTLFYALLVQSHGVLFGVALL
jgi:uncharacterized membrane protein